MLEDQFRKGDDARLDREGDKEPENAEAVLSYLETIHPHYTPAQAASRLELALSGCGRRVIYKTDVHKLEAAEQARAQQLGSVEYKFLTNEEMLKAIDEG